MAWGRAESQGPKGGWGQTGEEPEPQGAAASPEPLPYPLGPHRPGLPL